MPVPALIATNVFLYASRPTRCCTTFVKSPKDGSPGKINGKTCVYEVKGPTCIILPVVSCLLPSLFPQWLFLV